MQPLFLLCCFFSFNSIIALQKQELDWDYMALHYLVFLNSLLNVGIVPSVGMVSLPLFCLSRAKSRLRAKGRSARKLCSKLWFKPCNFEHFDHLELVMMIFQYGSSVCVHTIKSNGRMQYDGRQVFGVSPIRLAVRCSLDRIRRSARCYTVDL
jgi:hypothetical protein